MAHPHPDSERYAVRCGVITVSDTRSPETDKSGKLIQDLLDQDGHHTEFYQVVKDDPEAIETLLESLANKDLDVILLNGGTGIAPRDNTFDVVVRLLEKTLPGFGEIFRLLSYEEIGSRAIASRAVAGTFQGKVIFSMPGSSAAVRLAMTKLILPELRHLVKQLTGR